MNKLTLDEWLSRSPGRNEYWENYHVVRSAFADAAIEQIRAELARCRGWLEVYWQYESVTGTCAHLGRIRALKELQREIGS